MGMVVLLGLSLLLVVLLIHWDKAKRARRKQAWADVARRLGLDYSGDVISGRIDGVPVTVDIHTTGSGKNRTTNTRLQIWGATNYGVELAREGFLSSFSPDIHTGDASFDDVVRVRGDEAMAFALLDTETRGLVLQAVVDDWILNNNGWRRYASASLGAEVGDYIAEGIRLASHVNKTALQAPERLLERVRSDPDSDVRRRALGYLLARFASTSQRTSAVAIALKDSDAEVRLMAASAAGDAAMLLAFAGDPRIASEARARALSAAVRALARSDVRLVEVVEGMVAEVQRGAGSALAIAVAEALAVVRCERAEVALVALVGWKDEAVKLAAVRALAKVGTVDCVRALIPLRDRFAVFGSEPVVAAKEAILAIQARAGNSAAGGLAIAAVESGLAVVDE